MKRLTIIYALVDNDNKTFDHADYGVKVLFEQNLIKQIPVEEKYYNTIEKAVRTVARWTRRTKQYGKT